ncbi:hypothetical protein AG1IA_07258 [Rhizoctonia solani AG-1 IA]|uniref:Uncharacterized protein n=1 Tax=Thanatephorus cucumeris (strain AG1-IA) TaxID=983506 RepID=L8WPL9_THACA|nr:hypothetical protein AG1IA_07258 [Rhizoctonia solani AG-1 IA]
MWDSDQIRVAPTRNAQPNGIIFVWSRTSDNRRHTYGASVPLTKFRIHTGERCSENPVVWELGAQVLDTSRHNEESTHQGWAGPNTIANRIGIGEERRDRQLRASTECSSRCTSSNSYYADMINLKKSVAKSHPHSSKHSCEFSIVEFDTLLYVERPYLVIPKMVLPNLANNLMLVEWSPYMAYPFKDEGLRRNHSDASLGFLGSAKLRSSTGVTSTHGTATEGEKNEKESKSIAAENGGNAYRFASRTLNSGAYRLRNNTVVIALIILGSIVFGILNCSGGGSEGEEICKGEDEIHFWR